MTGSNDDRSYRLTTEGGRICIVQGDTPIAEMNEDRYGYVEAALGERFWALALKRARAMTEALEAIRCEFLLCETPHGHRQYGEPVYDVVRIETDDFSGVRNGRVIGSLYWAPYHNTRNGRETALSESASRKLYWTFRLGADEDPREYGFSGCAAIGEPALTTMFFEQRDQVCSWFHKTTKTTHGDT